MEAIKIEKNLDKKQLLNSQELILKKLISCDTTSSKSNLELINYICDYLDIFKIETSKVYNEDKSKASIYYTIGNKKLPGLVLSAHTDTVPVDIDQWSYNPYELNIQKDKYYGRGTTDMKGFISIVLALTPWVISKSFDRPIHVALSYDEEVGCIGAPFMIREMSKNLPKASCAIVGEPTLLKLVDGHKASIGLDTEVTGYEVHSSLLPSGVSAIMTASKLVNWITNKTEENQNKTPRDLDKLFNPPFTTLHVGKINGGTASNITAKKCSFTTDIRCLPLDDGEKIIEEYEKYAEMIDSQNKDIRPESNIAITRHHWVPGLKPENDGFADSLVRKITGENSTGKVSYGTEAGQFQEEGYSTVICGPGSIEQAHQADEFLSIDQLNKGTEFIKSLINEHAN